MVALPAWAFLGFSVLTGRIIANNIEIPIAIMFGVVVLQMIFVGKAYWRNDI